MNTFIAKLRVEGEQPFHLKHNESEEEGRMRRFTSVYPVILNELLFLRWEKKHNYTYLSFRGWDEKLQFDFDFFPLNFDLYYKLLLVPDQDDDWKEGSMTMKLNKDSFISVRSSGDYVGLLDPEQISQLGEHWRDSLIDSAHYMLRNCF